MNMKKLTQYILEQIKQYRVYDLTVIYDVNPLEIILQAPEKYSESDLRIYMDDKWLTNLPSDPSNAVKSFGNNHSQITDAYFEKQSTTDYNGVYKGRYIDFEAKITKSNTAFPLSNIGEHQIIHLQNVIKHGGIAFFIICFQLKDEIYLLDAKYVIDFYYHAERKSIPYEVFKKEGVLIRQDYNPRLHYIEAIETLYFK